MIIYSPYSLLCWGVTAFNILTQLRSPVYDRCRSDALDLSQPQPESSTSCAASSSSSFFASLSTGIT